MTERAKADAFVGRRAELRALERLLAAAQSGGAPTVSITGELGIGKTRLLRELRRLAEAAGFTVIAGRASELEREIPFALVIDALDEHVVGLEPAILRRLGEDRVAELSAVFPSLAGVDAALASPLEVERFRFHQAVRALLHELARERPLLLALDDLHWADRASLELVSSLLRRGVQRSLLVLATRPQRPDLLAAAITRVERDGEIASLWLDPLSQDEAAELLGEANGPRIESLYAESGGNPFFLEQLARAAPAGADALWAGASDETTPGVPGAVSSAIGMTLARLPERAVRLARAAAAIGDRFDVDLAAEVAGLESREAFDALDELVAADVVRPTETPSRLSFLHPIVRRAVYDAAGPGLRLFTHEQAASALARRGAPLGVRAHHVERSAKVGDAEAIALLVEAGESAAARAPAAAARWIEAALRLAPMDVQREQRLALLTSLANNCAACGRLRESRQVLKQALDLVDPADAMTRVQLTTSVARTEQGLGEADEAGELLAAALAQVEPDSAEAAALMLEQIKNHVMMRRWDAAADVAARVRAVARRQGDRDVYLTATASGAFVETFRIDGVSAEAKARCDEAAAGLDALDDDALASALLDALAQVVYAEVSMERWDSAAVHAERGVRLCRVTGQGGLFVDFIHLFAVARMLRGRLIDARPAADAAVEAAMLLENDQLLALTQGTLCWVASLQGETSVALAAGQNAVEAASRVPHSLFAWNGQTCFGEALVEAGKPKRGRSQLLAAGGVELTDVPPTSRPRWFKVLAVAELALGRLDVAEAMVQRAERLAEPSGLPMRTGDARQGRALVQLAREEFDAAARSALEAVELHEASGTLIDLARDRLVAATALVQLGDTARAGRELEQAHETFRVCGAVRLADRAARDLRRLGRPITRKPRRASSGAGQLSEREREVAELVARGYTNRQIAEELFLSQKTVETHLAHAFGKLGVSRRAAVANAVGRSQR